ncbi:class II aldolase/adducin family protein [Microbacterium sp. ARD31]|uniref:class II aldolase/adducin family protein n=1 Tax=Microbacterium sp. ARD31 TaxID=2962576 RepID=UPI00288178F5|nr:class II aldolase/adducin family protein [Microbacterium sp. ARD31]MDT0183966.1 class II aldolase/adducin family protein [Microbacterium sp. ARD31]
MAEKPSADADARTELVRAARVVAGAGLSDAFGHVSVRRGSSLLITAPIPLAFQTPADVVTLSLDADDLPAGVPKEAWIHIAIARADSHVGAICRAQPRNVARATTAGRSIRPLDGQGALLGPTVATYDDSRLVRDAAAAETVAHLMGDAPAIVLRGNGAVTRGHDLGAAVARMWLLDRSADLSLHAPTSAAPLAEGEQDWWRERDAELLPRIYDFLVRSHGDRPENDQKGDQR